MNRPIILQNFFNGAAVTEPKEFGAPKKLPILADGPTSTSGFANERVKVAFSFAAAARANNNNRDLFYAIALLPHQLPGIVDPRRWHCKQSKTQSQCGRSK
jgi:hypothetical protein